MFLQKQNSCFLTFCCVISISLFSVVPAQIVNASTRPVPVYVDYYISSLPSAIENIDVFSRLFEDCLSRFGDKCAESSGQLMVAGTQYNGWVKKISIFEIHQQALPKSCSSPNCFDETLKQLTMQKISVVKSFLAFDADFLARYGAAVDACSYHHLQQSLEYFQGLVLENYWNLSSEELQRARLKIAEKRLEYRKLFEDKKLHDSCVMIQNFGHSIAAILYDQIKPYEKSPNLIKGHTNQQRFVDGSVSFWLILANMEVNSRNMEFVQFLKPGNNKGQ